MATLYVALLLTLLQARKACASTTESTLAQGSIPKKETLLPHLQQLSPATRLELVDAVRITAAKLVELHALFHQCNYSNLIDLCREEINRQINDTRLQLIVFKGAQLVDEVIHPESARANTERRRRKSLLLVDSLADLLSASVVKEGTENERDIGTWSHLRPKRAICSSKTGHPDYSRHSATYSHQSNRAIQESLTSHRVGIIFSSNWVDGIAYGPDGEFGCIKVRCSDLGERGFLGEVVVEGYYKEFADIQGVSTVTSREAKYNDHTFSFGVIRRHSTGKNIGYFSFSGQLAHFDKEFTCITGIAHSCKVQKVGFRQSYSVQCGFLGWSRCQKTRVAYKSVYKC
eukprot:m.311492 g.311492  ORF g.311492 m.311492 type:complete len:345 (+) comp73151_c0_seq1:58-1092(+)